MRKKTEKSSRITLLGVLNVRLKHLCFFSECNKEPVKAGKWLGKKLLRR